MPQLYRFRTEIDEWRFNDSKRAITFLALQWLPAPIRRKKWEQTIEDQEINITMPLDVEPSLLFTVNNPSHPMWVDVYEESTGVIILSGKILNAKYTFKRGIVEFRVRVVSRFLDSKIPNRTYSRSCQFPLYQDGTCGVNEGDLTAPPVVGQGAFRLTVSSGDPTLVISASGLEFTHPDIAAYGGDFFRLGKVRNGVEELFVISHVGDTVITLSPFIRATNPNYQFIAGCDKLEGTCQSKFFPPSSPGPDGNIANYGGMPKMPRKNPVLDGY